MNQPTGDRAAPFFAATHSDGRTITTGSASYDLGHVIDGSDPDGPDGVFVRWRMLDGEFRLDTDRYGMYPCYYCVDSNTLRVSPSIPRLLADGAPATLDDEALAVFLRLGFFLDDRTPFRAIRAVPPGARLTWRNGQFTLTARGVVLQAKASLTRSAAVDEYIDLFREAIRRRPPEGRSLVPLSGGRDSRHILLELLEAGATGIECVSYHYHAPRSNDDVEIAQAACARLGVPHILLHQEEPRLRAELRKNRLTSFCTDEHAQSLVLADFTYDRTDTLYDGIAGDVLSGGLKLTPERVDLFARGDVEMLARHLLGERGENVIARLLTARAYQRFGPDLAVSSVASELARHVEAPNPVGSFFFWNRTRREIALSPYALLNGVRRVYAPYLDQRVFDFLASLPVAWLLDHTFHDEAIARAYPVLADLPYARGGNRALTPADRRVVRRFALEAAAYAGLARRSNLIQQSYVVPRFLRAALDGDYLGRLDWMVPFRVLHLLQIERCCTKPYSVTVGGRPGELRQRTDSL
jgi:asparagine synthase (glutamine-hydrolysing)